MVGERFKQSGRGEPCVMRGKGKVLYMAVLLRQEEGGRPRGARCRGKVARIRRGEATCSFPQWGGRLFKRDPSCKRGLRPNKGLGKEGGGPHKKVLFLEKEKRLEARITPMSLSLVKQKKQPEKGEKEGIQGDASLRLKRKRSDGAPPGPNTFFRKETWPDWEGEGK